MCRQVPSNCLLILIIFLPSSLEIEAQVLCALHVPLPIGQAAHGPRACVHHQRHHRPVPEDERDAGKGSAARQPVPASLRTMRMLQRVFRANAENHSVKMRFALKINMTSSVFPFMNWKLL